jgi:hypothetical protein
VTFTNAFALFSALESAMRFRDRPEHARKLPLLQEACKPVLAKYGGRLMMGPTMIELVGDEIVFSEVTSVFGLEISPVEVAA